MPPPFDIEPLVERVAARDERAFRRLYDATSPYLLGLLRQMLATGEMAEEVAQEVYVQVWRTAGRYDPGRGSAWTWLALLARSRAVDRMRADGSYRGALEGFTNEPAASVSESAGGNPERSAERSERGALVRRAMAELSPEQRSALSLAFFAGFSHSEIAERTNTPLGTVKTRIRTAMTRLRESLGPALER
ncbi:MAG: sigma-70 family RNA polymerase sigma factor [Gemmatimonadetes bacterium]|nr:sigma-70 family RNA polymerase sigma factor [Gemmatimonadota bacterium]